MAWFLVAATLVIVVAIAAAVIAWAQVMRDVVRLLERLTRPPAASGGKPPEDAPGQRRLPQVAGQSRGKPGHRLP
jgi:hypothetical protein